MEDRRWLLKIDVNNKNVINIFDDGYVLDNNGRKLFVLKKAAMGMVQELINEYSTLDEDVDSVSRYTIRCNTNPKVVSHNQMFFNQLKDLIYNPQNIKHPDNRLGSILEDIEHLRSTGELHTMIEADGQDAFIERLILKYCNLENNCE